MNFYAPILGIAIMAVAVGLCVWAASRKAPRQRNAQEPAIKEPAPVLVGLTASRLAIHPGPCCSYCGGRVRPDGYCKPCMKWGAD